MPDLTPAQRARILDAFQAMDDLAWSDLIVNPQTWTAFYYEGYITLAGLLTLTAVIAEMRLGEDPTP